VQPKSRALAGLARTMHLAVQRQDGIHGCGQQQRQLLLALPDFPLGFQPPALRSGTRAEDFEQRNHALQWKDMLPAFKDAAFRE
jgi:hypothetical protein